mgnify:CR=1 FL=1
MKEMKIGRNDAGQRLDKYLRKAVPALPPSLMQKYFRLKRIKLNGARTQGDVRLRAGDALQLYINDEFFLPAAADDAWRRIVPRLSVLYEDEHILLLDKRPGLVVHEDESQGADTLINHVKAYLYSRGEWDPDAEQSFTPALCNRIDRNTGGIVIAAKTAEALRDMNEKIRLHEVRKTYLCLAHGVPSPRAGTLRHFLRRDTDKKQVAVFDRPKPGALTAETHYRVLETRENISLVECTLVTGRTHQIRAQMAHAGHPLVGDTKYGTVRLNEGLPFRFQALYAYKVSFPFTAPSPALLKVAGHAFEVEEVPFLDFFQKLPVSGASRKAEKNGGIRT